MPHVTLLYPFRPATTFDAVEEELRAICRTVEPFDLRLGRFGKFHHGRQSFTLWLAPEPKDSLTSLQAALQSGFPDCDDVSRYPAGFTPHLSVGQAQGRRNAEKIEAGLQAAWKPVVFKTDRISLIRRGPHRHSPFRLDRAICLGE